MKLSEDVEISTRKGMTFAFNHEQNRIVLKASALTGKEAVYVNDQLVSKARNIKTHSVHTFTYQGTTYQIGLKVDSILKGKMTCTLSADGHQITSYQLHYHKRKSNKFVELPLIVLAGAAMGIGLSNGMITHWMAIVFIVVVAIWAGLSVKGQWVCTECKSAKELQV